MVDDDPVQFPSTGRLSRLLHDCLTDLEGPDESSGAPGDLAKRRVRPSEVPVDNEMKGSDRVRLVEDSAGRTGTGSRLSA